MPGGRLHACRVIHNLCRCWRIEGLAFASIARLVRVLKQSWKKLGRFLKRKIFLLSLKRSSFYCFWCAVWKRFTLKPAFDWEVNHILNYFIHWLSAIESILYIVGGTIKANGWPVDLITGY
jgi:hypothetical protein